MAPNTSSVFNEAPPQPQQPESKASDAGVLVAPPSAPAQTVEPASVPTSSVSAADTNASLSSTAAAMSTAAATGATSSGSMSPALCVDECSGASYRRRRRRQLDAERADHRDSYPEHSRDDDDGGVSDEDASALAHSERHFQQQQQLQMARFARVSSAALDGIKPALGFRKSCLKRPNSELPTDLSILKQEAAAQHASSPQAALPAAPALPMQKNRRRCWECKVKVGLAAVTCRCSYTFCNKHRYAEEHKCTFDFKVSAKRKLEEENPRVVPVKVARIN